jgi:hypothetical protein
MAFAADAEGYKYIVWVFNGCFAISSPQGNVPTFLEPKCSARSEYYHPLSTPEKKCCSAPKAALRTRASVRRASGFVQIALLQACAVSSPINLCRDSEVHPLSSRITLR